MLKIENSTSKLIRLQKDLKRLKETLLNEPICDSMLKDSYTFEAMRKVKNEIKQLFETASFC